ncbi:MAG: DUF2854 domain-containing protein [Oscillatoriales cyanobacterium SM2_2_1]|nr:DUF2854 domain-containing protein [Oscillatoriales cyanobacterium SM2_2_1]
MLGRISLGMIGIWIGAVLSAVGVLAYGIGNSTLNLVGLFYGVPILLGGAALKSAEVVPATLLEPTTKEVLQVRSAQETPTQAQIRRDVMRYRYGIEAHLDEALSKLGLSPTDQERPVLVGLYEQLSETQRYELVLRFRAPYVSWETWQEKQERMTRFFGPGIVAAVRQVEPKVVDVHLMAV